ncbi:hypothetical protein O7627_27525 [Solwaraspora sp. WMMD1047]|uniref:hypothetical protein n=1 Tax=Solwaraspora sp. WMMD1047 TaxID=3016102 RepID=UPI002416B058|nr:hypothetical protein [Solwaraspora sp. WMMD1047]MDG4833028.1 hypothetical protein [Solwaraspora sp. WMMD1047]
MCEIWDLGCPVRERAAEEVADSVVGRLADMIADAQSALITSTITWWLQLPPVDVEAAPAVRTLQEWMLPFALVIAVGGTLWQSLMLILSRRGEPLIAVVKGLFTTVIWGAVSVTGVHLLLQGGEAYTEWVLTHGLGCDPGLGQDAECKTDALAGRMQIMLAPAGPNLASILIVTVGMVVLAATVTQAILLLFRSGAILILAGLLQLAASGTFTAATSNWLRRVLGWLLALVFYEPFAATCYAVGFMLIGDRENTDIATWFTGVGMLGLSLVALPAMMRFFNWTVGSVQISGNSAGMVAAAGAAGMHAIASRRGVGGLGAIDYARDLDAHRPAAAGTGSGPGSARSTPPVFTGPVPAPATASSTSTTAASTASTTASTSAAAGAAASSGAAAAGPAGAVVAGAVVAGKVVTSSTRSAGGAATRATEGG